MKFKSVDDIEEQAQKKHIPIYSLLELTYRCNLKCVHCFADIPHHGEELSFREVVSVLEQLAAAGVFYIILSGGEPFIRKDLIDIVQYARQLGFAVTILTNATLITKEKADKISKLFPHLVKVSLYGATEKMFGKVTGNPRLFHSAIQGIRLLAEREIPTLVLSQIFNFNTPEDILAMKRICNKLAVKWSTTVGINLRMNGDHTPLKYRLSESQYEEFCKKIPEYIKSSKSGRCMNKKEIQDQLVCEGARSFIYITPYGQIGNCVAIISKNSMREKSILDIWRNDALLKSHRKLKVKDLFSCVKCESSPFCHPCPGNNLLVTGSFTKIVPDCCQWAHMRKKVNARLHPESKRPNL